MKKIAKNILLALIVITAIIIIKYEVGRVLDHPIVYKTVDGEICGCSTPEFAMPAKAVCAGIDMDNGTYEVVKVPACLNL